MKAIKIITSAIFVMTFIFALGRCSNNKEQPESAVDRLDTEIEQFLFGTWEVETFLGFQAITKEDIEWPDGEKIIGKSVIINNQLFSSSDFGTEYDKYALEVVNPTYRVAKTMNGDDFYSDYRISQDQTKISSDDTVQIIKSTSSDKDNPSDGLDLIIVNNSRLIIMLNCDFFELNKILE